LVPVFFAFVLLVPVAADAAPFRGSRCGYHLDLPDDWKPVPDADLRAMAAVATSGDAPKVATFDAAFQPSSSRRPFDYPYVVVQVVRYGDLGVRSPVESDRFESVMRSVIGRSGIRGVYLDASQQAGSPVFNPQVGEPSINRSRRRFTVTTEVNIAGRGNVRGVVTGCFGPDAMVLACYYAPAGKLDQAAAEKITESLWCDAPKEVSAYKPQANRGWLDAVRDRALEGALVGGIGGAAMGAIQGFKSRRNRAAKDDDASNPPAA